ncbi:MAG: leucine-rich repeat domain-containing protein [Clostridia bacterium]|nr:leucine-rich repeat domain-containing protein [Clostridia bacterium]
MFKRNHQDCWDIVLRPDGLDSRLQGLGNKILASEELIDATVEGVPFRQGVSWDASVHVRRIGRAVLAYVASVVLLLSGVWFVSHFLSDTEPPASSFTENSDPPEVSTVDPEDPETPSQEKPATEGLEFQRCPDGYMWVGLGSCPYVDIVIPSTYNDLPVVAIGLDNLEPRWKIQTLTIPASVVNIERDTLSDCRNLREITVEAGNPVYHSQGNCLIETATGVLVVGCNNSVIPDDGSVTEIGRTAFYHCEGLTEITIPEGVTTIGAFAFDGCSNLATVKLPSSLRTIEQYAFSGNLALTNPEIPDGVTRICMYAFSSCESITELQLPANLQVIEDHAFVGCSFTEITIPASVREIGKWVFWACEELEQVHFTNTDGWSLKYNSEVVVERIDVSSPTKAVEYLTDTYDDHTWHRN